MKQFSILALFLVLQNSQAFGPKPAIHSATTTSQPVWGVRPARQQQTLAPVVATTTARSFACQTTTLVRSPLHAAASSSNDDASSSKAVVKIIISGAPASGKGTQCAMIQEKFGVVHLSTGDMLRAAVADETQVGKQAKSFMDAGQLVPDEVIIGIVQDRLNQDDCQSQGWLLDGFPRTQAQAQALADAGVQADCFVFLNVPDEILVDRVVGRRTDPETGDIYHLSFNPPPTEEIAARVTQRSDDTAEKVQVRLEQFHANVNAVKESYQEIFVSIDGNQAKETVSDEIFKAIATRIGQAA